MLLPQRLHLRGGSRTEIHSAAGREMPSLYALPCILLGSSAMQAFATCLLCAIAGGSHVPADIEIARMTEHVPLNILRGGLSVLPRLTRPQLVLKSGGNTPVQRLRITRRGIDAIMASRESVRDAQRELAALHVSSVPRQRSTAWLHKSLRVISTFLGSIVVHTLAILAFFCSDPSRAIAFGEDAPTLHNSAPFQSRVVHASSSEEGGTDAETDRPGRVPPAPAREHQEAGGVGGAGAAGEALKLLETIMPVPAALPAPLHAGGSIGTESPEVAEGKSALEAKELLTLHFLRQASVSTSGAMMQVRDGSLAASPPESIPATTPHNAAEADSSTTAINSAASLATGSTLSAAADAGISPNSGLCGVVGKSVGRGPGAEVMVGDAALCANAQDFGAPKQQAWASASLGESVSRASSMSEDHIGNASPEPGESMEEHARLTLVGEEEEAPVGVRWPSDGVGDSEVENAGVVEQEQGVVSLLARVWLTAAVYGQSDEVRVHVVQPLVRHAVDHAVAGSCVVGGKVAQAGSAVGGYAAAIAQDAGRAVGRVAGATERAIKAGIYSVVGETPARRHGQVVVVSRSPRPTDRPLGIERASGRVDRQPTLTPTHGSSVAWCLGEGSVAASSSSTSPFCGLSQAAQYLWLSLCGGVWGLCGSLAAPVVVGNTLEQASACAAGGGVLAHGIRRWRSVLAGALQTRQDEVAACATVPEPPARGGPAPPQAETAATRHEVREGAGASPGGGLEVINMPGAREEANEADMLMEVSETRRLDTGVCADADDTHGAAADASVSSGGGPGEAEAAETSASMQVVGRAEGRRGRRTDDSTSAFMTAEWATDSETEARCSTHAEVGGLKDGGSLGNMRRSTLLAAAASPAAESRSRLVWRQGFYSKGNVWQRGRYVMLGGDTDDRLQATAASRHDHDSSAAVNTPPWTKTPPGAAPEVRAETLTHRKPAMGDAKARGDAGQAFNKRDHAPAAKAGAGAKRGGEAPRNAATALRALHSEIAGDLLRALPHAGAVSGRVVTDASAMLRETSVDGVGREQQAERSVEEAADVGDNDAAGTTVQKNEDGLEALLQRAEELEAAALASKEESAYTAELLEAAAALTLSRLADSDDASQGGGFGRPGENEKNEETPTVLAGQEGDSLARGGWRGADVGGHGRGADDTVRGLIDEVIDEVDSEGYRVYAVSGYY